MVRVLDAGEEAGLPYLVMDLIEGTSLAERMRFLIGTDPAITRKRGIWDDALKTDSRLQVESIRPLDTVMRMYDITTGTGDFIANGVVSHNCFARNTHTYLDLDSGADFNTKVVVKVNAPGSVACWPSGS